MAYLLTDFLGLRFELFFMCLTKLECSPVDTDFKWEILQKPVMETS